MKLEKLFNLDRRVIYIFIFLAVLIPFIVDFGLPIKANRYTQSVFDTIQKVGAKGGTILISFDFDMASKAELEPMARAVVFHAFQSGAKVVAMGHWVNGADLKKQIMTQIAGELKKEYGTDYAIMGYKPGVQIVIINMGTNFKSAFPTDNFNKSTDELKVTQNIRNLKDFDYVVSLSAGNGGIEEWVIYGQSKFGFQFGGGCTAVMAPDFYPYLQAGQLNGLIGGLVGAAQYEALIDKPGVAVTGMKPQSISHIVLIFFILFGNVCYFAQKFYFDRKRSNQEGM